MKKLILTLAVLFAITNLSFAGPFDAPEASREEKLQKKVVEDLAMMNRGFNHLKATLESAFDRVWNDSEFSAQEILDAYGDKAVTILGISQATKGFINSLDPDYVAPVAPCSLIANPDGTVTVDEASCV